MDSLRQYNVRLPEELIQTLQDVAKETGRDRAELVRDALTRYFDGELWRDETTDRASLSLSAKVEDLEKRVRRLEIAQPDIQAIQPTAKQDIQTARKDTHRHIKVGSDKPPRKDGLEWGERRMHRLADDKIAIEEVKTLWRLEPRPTFTEIGQLLGGYSRNSISAKVKELIALGEMEE